MNIEEYFVKEFKMYTDYKAHLLKGASPMNNARVSQLCSMLPTNEAMRRSSALHAQSRFLMGYDLSGGTKTFSSIIGLALPSVMQRVDNQNYIEHCVIRGVQEPYFSSLNNSLVKLQPRVSYKKRVTASESGFVKDVNGDVLTRDVDIPQGSRVVLSHTSIHLPNLIKTENGSTRRHIVSEGFGYLDYIDTSSGRSYLYYIPKKYIYPCNLCVLVLSESRLTAKYYWGRRYFFNRGVSSAYLYVAPYEPSILKPSNVIFCMKDSTDYSREIENLESYWQSCVSDKGVSRPALLYPFDRLHLYNTMGYKDTGDCNLAYQTLPQPERPPYTRVGKSLEEMDDNGAQDAIIVG